MPNNVQGGVCKIVPTDLAKTDLGKCVACSPAGEQGIVTLFEYIQKMYNLQSIQVCGSKNRPSTPILDLKLNF